MHPLLSLVFHPSLSPSSSAPAHMSIPYMHIGLIIGIVSMATILCFILCTTVVLVELLLHHRRHKIKRKRQTNVPTSTTNTITTSDAAPGITSPSNATRCNCTAPMQQNICYSAASIAQENREAGGSYPYSYPYLSSMSLADVSGIRTISEGQPNPEGMIRSTAADNRDGGNITTKQRSCDNEEDIYSYIIWHYNYMVLAPNTKQFNTNCNDCQQVGTFSFSYTSYLTTITS